MLHTIFELLAFALVAAGLSLRLFSQTDVQKRRRLASLAALALIGSLLAYAQGIAFSELPIFVLGMLLFNGVVSAYGSKMEFAYVLFGFVYLFAFSGIGGSIMAQAMLFGMLNEVAIMKSVKEMAANKGIELRRDVVQILGGVILMVLFVGYGLHVGSIALLSIILFGVFLVNVAKLFPRTPFSRMIYALERSNTSLGLGALWLALGSLVAVAALDEPHIIIVFSAIFIGDSAATIFGMKYKTAKLPWNRRKSIGGSFVYFVATAAISCIVMGPYAIPLAIAASLVESAPWRFDDNFTVSIALTVIFLAARLV